MKITKYDHSCFSLEKSGHTLLFDPVEYTHRLPDFFQLDAIIVTHLHQDHCQAEIIKRILNNHPQTPVFTTPDNLSNLSFAKVLDQNMANYGTFEALKYGDGAHCPIIPNQISPCQNLSLIVDNLFANPSDSYNIPQAGIKVLAVAIAAPWSSMEAASKLIERTKPQIVVPCHEAVLSDMGRGFYLACLKQISEQNGAKFCYLEHGESLEV